jgi:hypothetical protein
MKINMKKVLLVIIAVAIVVSAMIVVGVIVNATSDVVLNIKACNLSFSESIHIVYAVESKNVATSRIKMLYWTTPLEYESEYTLENAQYVSTTSYSQNVNGVVCRIFENEQLWTKNMTDTLYARACVQVGDKTYYSDVERYSILEYVYNKLGYTGTATTNENLLALLPEVLKYGADTQKYLEHNLENLPTDKYVKIFVDGGILPDGMDYGFYKVGTVLTLRVDPENKANKAKWIDADGNVIKISETIEIIVGEDHTFYTADPTVTTPTIPVLPSN